MTLPIKRITFYKHGLGFFERKGEVTEQILKLEFPRNAMDDILKSLVVISQNGQVLGLEFETPADRNPNVSQQPLELSGEQSLTDLLTAFRGRMVRVSAGSSTLEGQLVGSELEESDHLKRGKVSVYLPERKTVQMLRVNQIESIELLDGASGDLEFFLRRMAKDEERSTALLRLSALKASEGKHDLSISYIAPAPAWRVSYRLLAIDLESPDAGEILLQGWGLFDNTLGEDLDNVQLSLVAGMPVSFRYALHHPNTPERPLVEDEERTVDSPVMFAAAAPAGGMDWMEQEKERGITIASAPKRMRAKELAKETERSTESVASGTERGALFAYNIEHLVSVGRGQSAMVPIVSKRMKGRRELLFNERKHAKHPVASLRFKNETGLSLERGPVTVLENSDYAGEAVLDFSPAGAEIIVAFAVELGIQIRAQVKSETRTAKLSLHPGYLLIQDYHIQRTTYEIQNNTAKTSEITLEHNRRASYEFFEGEDPVEATQEFGRWRVQSNAQSQTTFEVSERAEQSRREEISRLQMKTLEHYLRHQYLDDETFNKLKGILELYDSKRNLEDETRKLEETRKQIYTRQTQIQGNLTPLSDKGEEGRLRSRLVTELGKLEDSLEQLGKSEQAMKTSQSALEEQIGKVLGGLKP
ncbi:MAG: hypothetical protein ACRCYY_08345 [Trueperaceae bacterium]